MAYTVKQLSEIAGVSIRTLRYYDEIDLLKPYEISESGYRLYSEKEVDLLQQILFYKAMDFKLEEIQQIITDKDFDINETLIKHRKRLVEKRKHIEKLITLVDKTIAYNKGEMEMTNMEKFEAFKTKKLKENETKYGKEIREKYGEETVNKANHKFMNLTEEAFQEMKNVEAEMIEALKEVIKTKDLDSREAKLVYEKHKEWLNFTWPRYTKEAHIGVAQMYVADERFSQYYKDKVGTDCAEVICEIIKKYAI